jgi:hypothetical protein
MTAIRTIVVLACVAALCALVAAASRDDTPAPPATGAVRAASAPELDARVAVSPRVRVRAPIDASASSPALGDGLAESRAAESAVTRDEVVSEAKTVHARFLLAGYPVAGVSVNNAASGADGRLALTLNRRFRGFLIATQPDGAQFRLDPPQDDAETAELGDIALRPAGQIAGVVVDAGDKPVVGAEVALLSSDLDCRTVETTRTDAEGRFRLPRVGPYRYEVSVRAEAPAGTEAEAFGARVTGIEAGATPLRVVAGPMSAVKLRLIEDATGEPVTGSWIACELRRPGARYDDSVHELRRNVNSFGFLVADPGWYEVDVRLGGLRRSLIGRLDAVEIVAGRANVIDVRMKER